MKHLHELSMDKADCGFKFICGKKKKNTNVCDVFCSNVLLLTLNIFFVYSVIPIFARISYGRKMNYSDYKELQQHVSKREW